MPRLLRPRALVLLALLVGCAVPASEARPRTLPAIPVTPSVNGTTADRAPTPLARIAAGRPMVVDFFASWCAPCRTSMPLLQAYADEHGSGLVVVGVSVGEDAADVEPFVRELGVRYPIFLDRDFALADAVGAKRVPQLLVVDASGRIVHRAHELDAATRAAVDLALATPAEW